MSFNDKTIDALATALNFRQMRQEIIASNIANSETPGYKAKRIDFEEALARALDVDGQSSLKATDKRPEIKINWRIYTKNTETPLIRDLIIEGLSLARTQKEEFASVLSSNNGDINALFKTLEEFTNK